MFPAPPPEATRSGGRSWGQADWAWLGGVGVSVAVHLAMVFSLGAVWMWATADAQNPPEMLLVTTAEPPSEFEPEALTITALPSEPARSPEAAGGRTVGEILEQPAITAPEPSRLVSSRPPIETGLPGEAAIAGSLNEDVGAWLGLGGLGGVGSGEGRGSGDGAGDGFFGLRHPDGTSFVYVVDCSSSMGAPHPSQWKTRLGRVKVELLNSIGTLSPERSYFVIFFNAQAHPMPATGLLKATPENKERGLEWIVRVSPAGPTDPRQALMMALRLRPDVIYFLTDGSFTADVSRDLGRLRQRQSAIHTFAFGDRAGERTLKWIAEHNRGEYHFVP